MRTTAKVNHGLHYAIPQCNRSLVTNEEEMADRTPPTAAPANFETLKCKYNIEMLVQVLNVSLIGHYENCAVFLVMVRSTLDLFFRLR